MSEAASPSICANCGMELSGAYCAFCGQRVVSLRPTLHELSHEAFHEVAHFDGKILKTLRLLLTRPGYLTREFLSGRRARYITPIRLYLICSLVFFVMMAILPTRQPWKFKTSGDTSARLQKAVASANRDPAIVGESLKHNIPKAMFVLMPLFGGMLFALYRRVEPTYVPHLYFAVHYHAFLFALLTIVAIVAAVPSVFLGRIAPLGTFASLPYLVIALRNVYGGTRGRTIVKATAIWIVYGVIVTFTVLSLTLLALWGMAASS